MPKNSLVSRTDLKSIYTSAWLHTAVWAYVSGQRRCGTELATAVQDFINFFGVEDLELKTLLKIYDRKNREYQQSAMEIKNDISEILSIENDVMNRQLHDKLDELKGSISKSIDAFKA